MELQPQEVVKKRKIVHATTRSGKRKRDVETKTVPLKKMQEVTAMELLDSSQLTMKEIISRAEGIERMRAREVAARKRKEKGGSASAKVNPVKHDKSPPCVLAPQVEVVYGRNFIKQQNLVVAAQASTRENTDGYSRVEEVMPKINYNSYSNREPGERRKTEKIELFYKAVQQFGTDFELIQNLLPGRTRAQVKAKYKKEEKRNPLRIADALVHNVQNQSQHYGAILKILKS